MPRRGVSGLDGWLLAALCALQIALVCSVRYFPSQDGPAHLETAHLLRLLWSADAGPAGEWFALNQSLAPNWATQLLLAGLMGFVPSLLAERILIVAYVVAFAAAMWFCFSRLGRGATALAVLALPLALSFPFHLGFYNFVVAMVLATLALALWIDWIDRIGGHDSEREALGARRAVAFATLLAAVYLCHPVAFGAVALVLLTIEVSFWAHRRASPRRALSLAAALAPAALLGLLFLFRDGGAEAQATRFTPVATLWQEFATFRPLTSFTRRELWVSVPFVLLLGSWALARLIRRVRRVRLARLTRLDLRRGRPAPDPPALALRRGLGLGAAVTLAAYFFLPAGFAGGGGVNVRLLMAWALWLLLWLGAGDLERWERSLARLAGTTLVAAQVALLWPAYRGADGAVREFVSMGPRLRAGATLLSIVVSHNPPRPLVRPLIHAAGHLAVERGVVDLSNYQAALDYFPVRYRPEMDPYRVWPGNREPRRAVPRLGVEAFARRGLSVDYVAVWDPALGRPGKFGAVEKDLGADYELTYRSAGGSLALFARRASASR